MPAIRCAPSRTTYRCCDGHDRCRQRTVWRAGSTTGDRGAIEVTTERHAGVLSIRVGGRTDGANARRFEETIRNAIEDGDSAAIVDFERLVYIRSAGLRAVLMTAKGLWRRDARLALCSAQDVLRAAFAMSGFDKIVAIHRTRADALAALRDWAGCVDGAPASRDSQPSLFVTLAPAQRRERELGRAGGARETAPLARASHGEHPVCPGLRPAPAIDGEMLETLPDPGVASSAPASPPATPMSLGLARGSRRRPPRVSKDDSAVAPRAMTGGDLGAGTPACYPTGFGTRSETCSMATTRPARPPHSRRR